MWTAPITVEKYMTRSPHSIGAEQPLSRAQALMREHDVRHLPVLHGGRLVGILTDRDVRFADVARDDAAQLVTAGDAMATAVYAVAPDAPLGEVASEMAAHKYGSTVVMQGHKVVGIFTTVDACRALAALLRGDA